MSQRIQGVLLDIDGTLVDSNGGHTKAWHKAFEEFGYAIDKKDIREKIGMGGDHLVPELAKVARDSKLKNDLDSRRREIFHDEHIANLKPFPSTQQLLEFLSGMGLELIAATSAPKGDAERLIRQAGLASHISTITTSDDVTKSKPNSDVIEAAALKSGLSKAALFMIGDTPYDIEAARTAHIPIIAFTCGGWSKKDLSDAQSVFADPHELLEFLKKQDDPLLALHEILFDVKTPNPFSMRGKKVELPQDTITR